MAAVFTQRIAAQLGDQEVELFARTHVLRGIVYELVVDGEVRATKQNWMKRPGRFELRCAMGEGTLVCRVKQGFTGAQASFEVSGQPLETKAPTTADRRATRWRYGVLLLVALFVAPVLLFSISAALPTRVSAVAAERAPFSEPGKRAPLACDSLVTRRGCAQPQVTSVLPEEVEFAAGAGGPAKLRGTLALPRGPAGPHPTVVIVGGSGGNPRDPEVKGGLIVHHEPFRLYGALAEVFTQLGFAVLRYDKRTCRKCYPDFRPDFRAFRFTHFEDDVRAALRFLRTRADIDQGALVLVGHSQGGGIVARLGAEEKGVAAVIMLAGSTFAFAEGIPAQLRRAADIRERQLDYLNALLLRWQADDFVRCLEAARHSPDEPQECLHGVTARAFDEEAARARTTEDTIASLRVPLLALQGQLDRNINPAVIQGLRERLTGREAEVHFLEGVGHTFVHYEHKDAPVLDAQTAEILAGFLRSVPR